MASPCRIQDHRLANACLDELPQQLHYVEVSDVPWLIATTEYTEVQAV